VTTDVTSQRIHALQAEHRQIRVLIGQLAAIEIELRHGGHVGARRVLEEVLQEMSRHVVRHMRQEEAQIFPLLGPAFGSRVPVLALLAEHHTIRMLVDQLASHLDQKANLQPWADRVSPVRLVIRQLAAALELHLRREEAAFGVLVMPMAASA